MTNASPPEFARRDSVEQELARILQSPHFRSSKRSQQFLRYVVEHSLARHDDRLKERAIGTALFDRPPDYDTGEDAAVRVAANEVRKRLAQYHLETPGPEVRIEIPSGGYQAEFHFLSPPAPPAPPAEPPAESPLPPAPPSPPSRSRHLLAAIIILAALAGAAALFWPSFQPESIVTQFWRPLLDKGKPVLICLAHPLAYLLADPSEGFVAPAPRNDWERELARRGVLEMPDLFVGVGDAYAASQFAALFGQMQKSSQVRIGNDVSFSDLRLSPAVLIGAYSNRWSMRMNQGYRFSFARYSIVDNQTPGRVWRLDHLQPGYRSPEDYLLVSRILAGDSGEPLVLAAGITNAGTHAAAELLTRPDYLAEALKDAPPDWQRRNLQLVLHCKVVGNTPGPPRLVVSHYW